MIKSHNLASSTRRTYVCLRPYASFSPGNAMSRRCPSLALLICLLLPPLAASRVKATEILPPHPRLLLDHADVAALKQRIAGPFAAQWKEYRAAVDRTMDDPVALPPRGGNWSHNYVCPTHGS